MYIVWCNKIMWILLYMPTSINLFNHMDSYWIDYRLYQHLQGLLSSFFICIIFNVVSLLLLPLLLHIEVDLNACIKLPIRDKTFPLHVVYLHLPLVQILADSIPSKSPILPSSSIFFVKDPFCGVCAFYYQIRYTVNNNMTRRQKLGRKQGI